MRREKWNKTSLKWLFRLFLAYKKFHIEKHIKAKVHESEIVEETKNKNNKKKSWNISYYVTVTYQSKTDAAKVNTTKFV